eukprot:CAMPEP_0185779942 /NCGR_PEP_ID=MMETSP1174-20130828/97513_1 /TAXON_ID=35687 /ORGANISM="Dictyocha speculum, Strain CCMP1381" /LENGTH=51 /DNA_ID=CAMNT_0028469283 /DNA_START=28 /DNA_END=180 /DNA_ORIENTATION=-
MSGSARSERGGELGSTCACENCSGTEPEVPTNEGKQVEASAAAAGACDWVR